VLRGGVTMRLSTGWNDYYQMLQVFFLLLGIVFIILGSLFWSFASFFFSAAICCAVIVFVQLWVCGSYLMKKSNIDNISNQRGEDEIYDNWIKVNENGFWKKTNNEDEPGNNFNRYAWSIAKFKPKGSSTDRLYVGTASLLPRLSKPEIYSSSNPKKRGWDLEFECDQRGFRKMKVFDKKLYVGTSKDVPIFRWLLLFLGKWGCKLYKYDGKGYNGEKWIQVIEDGFGTKCHSIRSMEVYKSPSDKGKRLYVGAVNLLEGGQVWRSKNDDPSDQKDWEQINADGFGKGMLNNGVFTLKEFNGGLWAGTNNPTGCEIWKYDGTIWKDIAVGGFNTKNNMAAMNMEVFDKKLYVGTFNPLCGSEIWRYPASTESGWEKVVSGGFDNPNNIYIWSLKVYEDKGIKYLYAGTFIGVSLQKGAELWRSSTGGCNSWEKVVKNGFNDHCNYGIRTLEIFRNHLYAGTARGPTIPLDYPKQKRIFYKECRLGCEVWKYPKD
ncbi:MAG: hypothetical protein KAW47_02455, partial [Thermoplasmatales archaeon]|nr:hypothetical protein [Thermoplasmatales archaeon]